MDPNLIQILPILQFYLKMLRADDTKVDLKGL